MSKKSFKEKYIMPILSFIAAVGSFFIYLFFKSTDRSEEEKEIESGIDKTKQEIKELEKEKDSVGKDLEAIEAELEAELKRHEEAKEKLSLPIGEVIETDPDKAYAKLKERAANAKKD